VETLFPAGYVVVVVFHCAGDDVFCNVGAVDADELHAARVLSRNVLIGAEVVDESADDVYRHLLDVRHHSIYGIALEYCYDLVVSLVVVEETESSDRACVDDDVSVSHILFGEDADV